MAHGTPDYGVASATKTVFPVTDLGELGVRLGAIDRHDRRGDVIDWDDFEGNLSGWHTDAHATGGTVSISPLYARSGSFSVQLYVGTVGNVGYARITRYVPYPVLSRLGLEFALGIHPVGNYLRGHMSLYTGDDQYLAEWRYDRITKVFKINTPGGWETIKTFTVFPENWHLFHVIKLVADFTTGKYVRAIFDNVEYDISDHLLYTAESEVDPYLEIDMYFFADLGAADTLYVDDYILTQNEP